MLRYASRYAVRVIILRDFGAEVFNRLMVPSIRFLKSSRAFSGVVEGERGVVGSKCLKISTEGNGISAASKVGTAVSGRMSYEIESPR